MTYFLLPRYHEIVFRLEHVPEELLRQAQGRLSRLFQDRLVAFPYGVIEMWTQRRDTEVCAKFNPAETTPAAIRASLEEVGIRLGSVRVRRRGLLKWFGWNLALFGLFTFIFTSIRLVFAIGLTLFAPVVPDAWVGVAFWVIECMVLVTFTWSGLRERDYNAPIIALLGLIASTVIR